MTIMYLYLAALAGLAAVLVLIARKTIMMVRDGQPLVAMGALQWHAHTQQRTKAQPQPRQQPACTADPAKPGLLAGLFARLRPAARVAVEPVAEAPPRERSRRLASLSEIRAAERADHVTVSAQAAARFAAATEPRFDAEFDLFCAGKIDLAGFANFVTAQQAELDRHLAAAPDAETLDSLQAAGAIIAFSRDWVSQQQ